MGDPEVVSEFLPTEQPVVMLRGLVWHTGDGTQFGKNTVCKSPDRDEAAQLTRRSGSGRGVVPTVLLAEPLVP